MISNDPKRSVPHREPFLWIDRLISRNEEGTEGVCEYDVKPELPLFKGHFPNRPIFPGVIQMEAAAQACLWITLGVLPADQMPPDVLFVSVESYKFRKPVEPPATLTLKGKQRTMRGNLFLWDVEIEVAGETVSKGAFWMYKAPREVKS